jgi:5-hydroxyisourate hydrolase
MGLTVQVVDIVHGCPAGGVDVRVEHRDGTAWARVTGGATDDGGRLDGTDWLPEDGGSLRLVLDVQKFYATLGLSATLAEVSTALRVHDRHDDHRVWVLLAPTACTFHTDGPTS